MEFYCLNFAFEVIYGSVAEDNIRKVRAESEVINIFRLAEIWSLKFYGSHKASQIFVISPTVFEIESLRMGPVVIGP